MPFIVVGVTTHTSENSKAYQAHTGIHAPKVVSHRATSSQILSA
jgi:hypothetical protein